MIRFDEEWFKEENQNRFAWRYGVIGFGVPFGLITSVLMVLSNDLSNHPLLNKIGIVVGMTLIGGPFAGWFFGHLMWALKRSELSKIHRREEVRARLENRIADLEAAVRENTEAVKQLSRPNAGPDGMDSNSRTQES